MAQQEINVGNSPNDGQGNPIRTAFIKCNDNFDELYARAQASPPPTLIGSPGDEAGFYASDSSYFYFCFADYDGSSIIWGQVTQVGNITVSSISSGTSNVKIADINGNATISIAGTSNVVVVSAAGQFVNGVMSATGNITGSYFLGNGSQLSGLPETYNNANVISLLAAFGSNSISSTGTITAGNVTGGNLLTNNIISATGNITTSGFFLGDFIGNIVANITNIPGPGGAVVFNNGSGNAAATAGLIFDNSGPNVLTVDGSYSATGNITGTNITGTLATAAQPNITSVGTLSSLSVSANVQGGNLRTTGQISATGSITSAGNIVSTNLQVTQNLNVGGDVVGTNLNGSVISAAGNITGGNIRTGGQVSATGNIATAGNITGSYFLGNGRQLTGIESTLIENGNSNVQIASANSDVTISVAGISPVVAFTPTGQTTNGLISATGNVIGGNLVTSALVQALTVNVTGNITGGNLLFGSGVVSGSGNITGGNLLFGSGVVSGSGNITSGNILFGSHTVSGSGNITGGNLSVSTGSITVGNIVNGNGNGVGNIGSSTTYFNTVFAKATSAEYADLAENYVSDAEYAPGTVVIFGGSQEITVTDQAGDERVAGAVSTKPAYLMNSGELGTAVALRGRVPVNVIGPVIKGDSLVTSTEPGYAISVGRDRSYGQAVFAKALETNIEEGKKMITAVVL